MKKKQIAVIAPFLVLFAMFAAWYVAHHGTGTFTWAGMASESGVVRFSHDGTDFVIMNQTPGEFYSVLRNNNTLRISPGTNPDSVSVPPIIELPDSTPIAYWPLDMTAADAGPNAWDGAIVGATWSTGYRGAAAVFSGDSRITLPPVATGATDGITIMAWVWLDAYNSDARIISKATGTSESAHDWMVSTYEGGRIRFRLKTIGGTTTLISGLQTLTLAHWYNVAVTYDGLFMRIYQDGIEIASRGEAGSIVESGAGVAIGNQPAGAGSRPWRGRIDEVRIFTRALSRNEIQRWREQ